jgi:electron transfer flavoprotein alpha subunit
MADTVLAIAEQHSGQLSRISLETVAAAQAIAKQMGWQVELAVLGSDVTAAAQDLAAFQSARVYALASPRLERYTADGYTHALRTFLATHPCKLILLPHTYQVRDFAPSLALALGTTVISDTVSYRFENNRLLFTRQMFQGKFAADVSFAGEGPYLVTFQNAAFRSDQAQAGTAPVETVAVEIPAEAVRVQPQEVFQEAKHAVDLTQAEIIVAVGRGIKEQKNLALAEALATALGGELAASRPICDAGWLPLDRQVGSSGQTVAPKLYLALGISGAIQHIVGMKGARSIVAINKDAEAPIFEIADIGIVGNLFDIIPALTEEIKKTKAGA